MPDTLYTADVTHLRTATVQHWSNHIYRGSNPIYATTTGSANAQILTIPTFTANTESTGLSLISALSGGDEFTFKAGYTNTGALTLQIVGATSLTARAVQCGGAALSGGEWQAGDIITVRYEATATVFQMAGTGRFLQLGTGAVLRSLLSKAREVISIKDFGAIGDWNGSTGTDNRAAIQLAIDYAATFTTGATVVINLGAFKLTNAGSGYALSLPPSVSMRGEGGSGSVLYPVSCDAIRLVYGGAEDGPTLLSDFGIRGVTCSAYVGISHIGTASAAVQAWNHHITRLNIQHMGCGVSLRTAWMPQIKDCIMVNNDSGIRLIGQTIDTLISGNYITRGTPPGGVTYPSYAVYAISASDYDPGGSTTRIPEGLRIVNNDALYGYDTAIGVFLNTWVTIDNNDIQALIYGIRFSAVTPMFNITNNHVEVDGASVIYGIWAEGLSTAVSSKCNIDNNEVIATGGVASVGIQLNNSLTQNQTNFVIEKNSIYGFATSDIDVRNAGGVIVRGNNCYSGTTATQNIVLAGALSASLPYVLEDNYTTGYCATNVSNNNALVRIGHNWGGYVTFVEGVITVTNGQTTASLNYSSLLADQGDFRATADSNIVPWLELGTPNGNIGYVYGAATVTGISITCSVASTGTTTIPFKVVGKQANSGV